MIQCSKVAEIEDYAQNWWIQVIANVCKWGLFTKCKWIACTEFAREIQINNESGAGFRLMQTKHLFKFWVKPSEIIKKNHKLFGLEMNVVDYISFLFNFLLFKLTGIFGFFHLASNLETARVTYTTIPAPNVSIIWFSKKWYGFFMKNSLELQLAIIYFATMLQIHYLINIKLFGANITLFNSFQQSIQAKTKWLINIFKSALTNETALFLR